MVCRGTRPYWFLVLVFGWGGFVGVCRWVGRVYLDFSFAQGFVVEPALIGFWCLCLVGVGLLVFVVGWGGFI
jgi:hypothetical protein